MNIVAKTILDKKQIDAKIKKGYETFKIQLLDEYYDEDFSFNETLIENCDIMSVHTPLVSGDETTIGYGDWYKKLDFTCDIAQKIAIKKNHDIIVVVHFTNFNVLLLDNDSIGNVIDILLFFIEKYPYVKIGIENSTMLSANKLMGREHYIPNNSLLENVTLAILCHNDRIGVVLDTCHMMSDCYMAQQTLEIKEYMNKKNISYDLLDRKNISYDLLESYTYREFFRQCKNRILFYHLANGEEFCDGKQHGLPFDKDKKEDVEKLKEILDLYDEYGEDVPIVLEIMENDYIKCENLEKTKECLDSLINKK